ncbi:hypothetical protein Deba_3138 [Desulfarculus baarsii DSM 2075]|uniref:Uncharacterized protein n=1 Tax=Desulfarculus baarsii (strain ATCC 33931 / DSM 2075 / LMG 7858 / VKM B-1802 / 2st14) TaxID=644282 RepID=E1QLQ6_DESB2|nr:hypothetical protein [Desulfarculus baarsii]ADK86491.1 hypothetical protein Deba_3138 [Desulfarculus baarsii DSM 2075]
MKRRIDIYLGLFAWLLGVVAASQAKFSSLTWCVDMRSYGVGFYYTSFDALTGAIPLLWTASVAAMIVLRQRPLRKLWWVWLSFPLAFIFYVFISFMVIGEIRNAMGWNK